MPAINARILKLKH